MPARNPGGELLGERALHAHWQLADGSTLHLLANLDDRELSASGAPGEPLASTERPPSAGEPLPGWYVAWTLAR
jgi:hypothetical protein